MLPGLTKAKSEEFAAFLATIVANGEQTKYQQYAKLFKEIEGLASADAAAIGKHFAQTTAEPTPANAEFALHANNHGQSIDYQAKLAGDDQAFINFIGYVANNKSTDMPILKDDLEQLTKATQAYTRLAKSAKHHDKSLTEAKINANILAKYQMVGPQAEQASQAIADLRQAREFYQQLSPAKHEFVKKQSSIYQPIRHKPAAAGLSTPSPSAADIQQKLLEVLKQQHEQQQSRWLRSKFNRPTRKLPSSWLHTKAQRKQMADAKGVAEYKVPTGIFSSFVLTAKLDGSHMSMNTPYMWSTRDQYKEMVKIFIATNGITDAKKLRPTNIPTKYRAEVNAIIQQEVQAYKQSVAANPDTPTAADASNPEHQSGNLGQRSAEEPDGEAAPAIGARST